MSQLKIDTVTRSTRGCISDERSRTKSAASEMPLQVDCGRSSKAAVGLGSLLTPPDSPGARTTSISSHLLQQLRAKSTTTVLVGNHECPVEPVSWELFKIYVDAEDLDPLGRSVETQAKYEIHKTKMMGEYGTMANYLKAHVLADFIAEKGMPGFDADSAIGVADFTFRINDFPYHIGDGVEHWVLWCLKRLQPGFAAPEAAVRAITQKFGENVECRYFVNPVNKQSVPQLSHAHVFVRKL
ncbi:hypothetical protein LPJ66_010434 [Kickxella alabastrina]|uniref:Uncharacterized protein n=1 Tax=Kickxella alabastrina TaxID=61397 RepID=A0ACC1I150_9FUNG|nr:hypothetical protein LPJ66_010434 [Kickxella alabastrina]